MTDTTRAGDVLTKRHADLDSESRWLLDGSTQGRWKWGNDHYDSVEEAADAVRQAILNTGTSPILYMVDVDGASPIICLTGNGPNASRNAELISQSPELIRGYRALVDDMEDHIEALQQRLDAAEAGAASTAVYMVWTADYAEVAYFLTEEAAYHFIDNDLFVIRNTIEEGYGHNEKYPWQVRSILEDDEYQMFATREEAEAWLETNTPRSLANINWGELHAPGVNDLKQRLDAAERRAGHVEYVLAGLLDVAERYRGGDTNMDIELWYSWRDAARAALTEQERDDA